MRRSIVILLASLALLITSSAAFAMTAEMAAKGVADVEAMQGAMAGCQDCPPGPSDRPLADCETDCVVSMPALPEPGSPPRLERSAGGAAPGLRDAVLGRILVPDPHPPRSILT